MTQDLVVALVFIVYAMGALITFGTLLTWVERKQAAVMSDRIGANRAYVRIPFTQWKLVWWGLFHGVADGIKMLLKENFTPQSYDRVAYAIAPWVVFTPVLLVFAVVPFGGTIEPARLAPALADWFGNRSYPMQIARLDAGLLIVFAFSGLTVIGAMLAGWSSANKFSLLGALRAAAQLIAYELPLLLAVVGVVIQAGTMSLQGIVAFQSTGSIFGWSGIGFPFILTQFIGFGLFLVASQAELTQTPFDMPVAESELVAGYMVEYTGFRFLFFFIGEFGTAFAFSAIAATIYLGGWALPASWGIPLGVMRFLGPFVLFAKVMGVAFLMFWVRFTYPRLREDQLQALAWKFLIPIGLLNILLTGVFKVAI